MILKPYESVGEVPLLNALVAAFPDSIGLRCFIHMEDNIRDQQQAACNTWGEVCYHAYMTYLAILLATQR